MKSGGGIPKTLDDVLCEGEVRKVRACMLEQGGGARFYTDKQVLALLNIIPDADLAATALMMDPRPQWVKDVVGR